MLAGAPLRTHLAALRGEREREAGAALRFRAVACAFACAVLTPSSHSIPTACTRIRLSTAYAQSGGDVQIMRGRAHIGPAEGYRATCPWDENSDAAALAAWKAARPVLNPANDRIGDLLIDHPAGAGQTEALAEMAAGHTGRRAPIGVPHLLERLSKPTCPWTKERAYRNAHYAASEQATEVERIEAEVAANALAAVLHQRFGTLAEAFLEADDDRNGRIAPAELRRLLHVHNLSQTDVAALIASVDTNGDGDIQFNEFAALVDAWFGSMKEAPRAGRANPVAAHYAATSAKGAIPTSPQKLPPRPPPFAVESSPLAGVKAAKRSAAAMAGTNPAVPTDETVIWTHEHDSSTNQSHARDVMEAGASGSIHTLAQARAAVAESTAAYKLRHHAASNPLW